MKELKIILFSSLILLYVVACSIEPIPINYGKDACIYCQMNIVDKQHAAEIVTSKGKAYKYDAIECMMRDINERMELEISLYLITDYDNPGELVDATKCIYLISEQLPSPMGANLTGFFNSESAKETMKNKSGTIYNWTELNSLFSKN